MREGFFAFLVLVDRSIELLLFIELRPNDAVFELVTFEEAVDGLGDTLATKSPAHVADDLH